MCKNHCNSCEYECKWNTSTNIVCFCIFWVLNRYEKENISKIRVSKITIFLLAKMKASEHNSKFSANSKVLKSMSSAIVQHSNKSIIKLNSMYSTCVRRNKCPAGKCNMSCATGFESFVLISFSFLWKSLTCRLRHQLLAAACLNE